MYCRASALKPHLVHYGRDPRQESRYSIATSKYRASRADLSFPTTEDFCGCENFPLSDSSVEKISHDKKDYSYCEL
jgi:hypothetical protein